MQKFMMQKLPVRLKSPDRVREDSGNFTPDGKPMWVSRKWQKGERAKYCREVLNREPYDGES